MRILALLVIGFLSGGDAEYTRSLGAKDLDQATLDVEGYGVQKALQREDAGLRMVLGPGEQETGWKTPQQLSIGGNFQISANVVIKTLPKPAQEDGAAVGLAIAFQNINQPDVTLVRMLEPKGDDVYRCIEKSDSNPGQPQPPMPFPQPMGGNPAKPKPPPRRTFPASGATVRLELQREGGTIRFQVLDAQSEQPRYLGQATLGPNDVAAVKLFVSNRSGAEAINVLWRDLTIHADRITGLGTQVRTVFDKVVYGDPTALEAGALVVGGQPKAPPPDKADPTPGPPNPAPAHPAGAAPPAPAPHAAAAAPKAAAAQAAPAPPAVAVVARAAVPAQAPAGAMVLVPANATDPAPPPSAPPPHNQATHPSQPPPPPKPKARIPLDEVESIRFERTPTLTARFLGQPNLDFTMPGLSAPKDDAPKNDAQAEQKKADAAKDDAPKAEPSPQDTAQKADAAPKHAAPHEAKAAKTETRHKDKSSKDESKQSEGGEEALAPPPGTTAPTKFPKVEPKPNGIRDLWLSVVGLREAKIKQIMVNCPSEGGPTNWRLDTTDSQDWPLVLRRSGNSPAADLFLEPPPGDCFQKDFTININYEDGQAANATAKAKAHTDPRRAVDPKKPESPRLDAWVDLTGAERLFGKLERIGQETLTLTTPWQDTLDVPLTRVVGIRLGLPEPKESPESFAKRLKSRGVEDLLLAQTKKGEVLAIPGVVEGTAGDKLRFRYQDKSRTLPLQQVEGLILAARPEPKEPDELRCTFTLPGGVTISGRWKDIDTSTWKIETAWGQELGLPAAAIQGVRFRGGRMTYLSDLNPSQVEETPFFGHRFAWRRDVNLVGGPLKMNGQTYERGVAVHSRCSLTYDLNGRFTRFEALVGFDDAARGKGRVACRVVADGKAIYAHPDLRADQPPVKLALPVAGVEQLRLVVDFGRGQDTGDRVIWANARLLRPAAPTQDDPPGN
jgi:hypothetical protein